MKTVVWTFLALFGVGFLTACNKVEFDKAPGPSCQGFGTSCVTQSGIDYFDYNYVTPEPNLKTDVLIVDDNSDSMQPEQANMASRFSTFLNKIRQLDWRVGIVTTDMNGTGPTQDGNLLPFNIPNDSPEDSPETRYYLTKTTCNGSACGNGTPATELNTVFGNTVRRPEVGSGDERGIYAAIRAIEKRDRGFFRDDARLAVIILSDEDERSDGGQRRPLESGNDYPQDLIDTVNQTWSNKSVKVHSIIIKPGDQWCYEQQRGAPLPNPATRPAYYGSTYKQLSQQTGGIIGTVCASDYGQQLQQMGQVEIDRVGSVTIACSPIPGTLEVTAPSSWHLSGNEVIFTPPLPAGTTVHFRYQCTQL